MLKKYAVNNLELRTTYGCCRSVRQKLIPLQYWDWTQD